MTVFQEIVRLKIEQRNAKDSRVAEINARIKLLEPKLSHEEAVFIVKKYESD